MQRAHKIRLNPTREQQTYFRKAVGTARFVYHWGLSEVKRALDDGRAPATALELKARFNAIKPDQFPWVYAVVAIRLTWNRQSGSGAVQHAGRWSTATSTPHGIFVM